MKWDETPDGRVEQLARGQHQVFNYRQAISVGHTRASVHRRLATGRWIRLAHHVFALPSGLPTWRRQYKAAELSVRESAISGLAACKLHGLPDFRTVRPEVTAPYTCVTHNRLTTIHRAMEVPTTVVDGIRVTTVARTLFDVVSRVRVDRLETAMSAAILEGKLGVDELVAMRNAVDRSRRPGIGVWRALVEEHTAEGWVVPESVLESALLVVVRALEPDFRVVRQATLPWWSEGEGRVDVLLPDVHTILEADGRRWHAKVKAFDRDHWRDNVAQSHGYDVLRFTHLQLTQRPDEVLQLILDTLRWKSAA